MHFEILQCPRPSTNNPVYVDDTEMTIPRTTTSQEQLKCILSRLGEIVMFCLEVDIHMDIAILQLTR